MTGCSAGEGFRALVGARHAVPLCGEGVCVGDVAVRRGSVGAGVDLSLIHI